MNPMLFVMVHGEADVYLLKSYDAMTLHLVRFGVERHVWKGFCRVGTARNWQSSRFWRAWCDGGGELEAQRERA